MPTYAIPVAHPYYQNRTFYVIWTVTSGGYGKAAQEVRELLSNRGVAPAELSYDVVPPGIEIANITPLNILQLWKERK